MLVQILDGSGNPHFVSWQGQDQINDRSGTLGVGSVGDGAAFQEVMPANQNRAGWLFQNTSQSPMLLFEINEDPEATSAWFIPSGGIFPPYPGYPIPVGSIMVQGTVGSNEGDTYAARDWQTASNE